MAADDEDQALKIQENLKAAVANIWPRPFDAAPLAGTVTCPECLGNPRIRRLTPDFAKAFGMDEPWDFKISKRIGSYQQFTVGPRRKTHEMLEYPGERPIPVELPVPRPEKPGGVGKGMGEGEEGGEGGFKV